MKIFSYSFWLHSFFYTFLQRFSLFFFGAVSYILMAHGFEPAAFSNWALFVIILSLIETAKNGLLRNPGIKFLSIPEYDKERVETASLIINISFSLFILIALIIGRYELARWLQSPSLVMLLNGGIAIILFNIIFSHFEMILQSKYLFAKIFRANFARHFIFFLGVLALYFFPEAFNLENILLAQVAGSLVGAVLMMAGGYRHSTRKWKVDKALMIRMMHFGKYTFGTNFFSQLGRSFDHTLTAVLLDPIGSRSYVAYYNVVTRINNMMDVPSLAAADVSYPRHVETMEKEGLEKVSSDFERVAGSILAIMLPVSMVILIFPGTVLMVIGGRDYLPAIPLLQLAIIFGWVRPLSYQFGSVLDAIGKPGLNFRVNVLFLAASLLLHYTALRLFGGIGAALAMAVLYVLMLGVMLYILNRYIHIRPVNILRSIATAYGDGLRILRKFILPKKKKDQ